MNLRAFSLRVVCFLLACGPALAEPISYTFSGRGSGSLGGVSFADADFTIRLVADTGAVGAVADPTDAIFAVTGSASSIEFTGGAMGSFLGGTGVFVNQTRNIA